MQNKHIDFVALGGSLFITFVILGLFYSYILIQKDREFILTAEDLNTVIKNRLVNYEQVLYSTQGLFLTSDHVTSDEWRHFVQNQQIDARFPGVQVVGYSQKIGNAEDLAKHIQQMRINYPNYTVHPDTPRDEYNSIIYIEPVNVRNLRSFGYDMFTEPTRRVALEQARDTGVVTITGKVTLVQEIDKDVQPGFLMFLPVYKNGQTHDSIEQKRDSLQGFVYCAFRAYDLFNAILPTLKQEHADTVRIKVYDTAKDDQNLLYDSKIGLPDVDWKQTQSLDYGHRIWVIEYSRLRTFTQFETTIMVAIPAIGVSMSAFVFLAIRSSQRNTSRIIKLNEDLLKSEKLSAVGHLASRLAHDIRNPLSIIKNTTELLTKNSNVDEKLRLQLERIDRAATKINNQVIDILDFVRTKPLQIQENSSQKIISATLDRIEKPAGITLDTPKNDYAIKCDAEKIEIVLANLITNSIQALGGQGTINLTIHDNDKFMTIEVEDSGPGIPEDVLPKIFEPLFTTKPNGTGLGLASVKSIITQHGGSIYVKSNPTTFTVNLPK